MSTEYYLVKPNNKEYFYLGKHFPILQGIKDASFYDIKSQKDLEYYANYIQYDCIKNLMLDIIKETDDYYDLYLQQILIIAQTIFEWCDYPVILFSDCNNNFSLIKDYKETGSILNIFADFKNTYDNLFNIEEELSDIISLIPSKFWISTDHVIQNIPTIVNYIKSIKG